MFDCSKYENYIFFMDRGSTKQLTLFLPLIDITSNHWLVHFHQLWAFDSYEFSYSTVFFSHNKSVNSTFSHGLSVKRHIAFFYVCNCFLSIFSGS